MNAGWNHTFLKKTPGEISVIRQGGAFRVPLFQGRGSSTQGLPNILALDIYLQQRSVDTFSSQWVRVYRRLGFARIGLV